MAEPKATEIIMRDSPEAATYRTDITGWVSRDGFFYGDGDTNKATARYAGCTHVSCSGCGVAVEKRYVRCTACQAVVAAELFAKRPRAAWDGEAMLYSDRTEDYYADLDAVVDAINDMDVPVSLADMRLIICEPNRGDFITDDHFADALPEDDDSSVLPQEVWDAMDAFNKVIAGIRPLSWSPGKFALDLDAIGEAAEYGESVKRAAAIVKATS